MDLIQEDILMLESFLDVKLPKSYKDYLKADSRHKDTESPILGFPLSLDLDSVWGATEFVRAARPELGQSFLAVRMLGSLALCLDMENGDESDAPVVEIDLESDSPPAKIYESLIRYLAEPKPNDWQDSSPQADDIDADGDHWFYCGLKRLDWHVEKPSFQYDHKDGGRLPCSHDWRPYRYCVQDVVLGCIVCRHSRKQNLLEVDVFMTTEHPDFPEHHGDRGIAVFALTEAFHCGGTMDIQFTSQVYGGYIPLSLVECAKSLGVELKEKCQGRITPEEARELYLALTPFSNEFRYNLRKLNGKNLIQPERACYLVHHGVWSPAELEAIVRSSPIPERVLSGSVSPVLRHLFQEDLLEARAALLGGFLDRKLAYRGEKVDLEDDVRLLIITFDGDFCDKIYDCDEEAPLPWIVEETADNMPLIIDAKKPFRVLIRARDASDILFSWQEDIKASDSFVGGEQVLLLYPYDFWLVDDKVRADVYIGAKEAKVVLLACPENCQSLDSEALQRLERSRVVRE